MLQSPIGLTLPPRHDYDSRMGAFRSFYQLMGALAVTSLMSTGSAGCGRPSASSRDAASVDPVQQTVAWRAKHEADYRREWATIAGLYFLHPGAQTAGSASSNEIVLPASTPPVIGRFVLDGEAVRFEPAAGVHTTRRGQPITSAVVLKDDAVSEPDEMRIGSVTIAVHRSGERKSLRVWDPDGPQARGFAGFQWFDIQPDYRVIGRFIRDPAPRTMKVVNTFGDFDEYTTEGVVEFTLNGRTLRLRPFTTRPKRFYFVFKDASSGIETYDAARFLYADLQDDGTTVLDFNQAYNPPCSFNPFTTCPIPLPENRLPIKVLAGERQYQGHVAEAGLARPGPPEGDRYEVFAIFANISIGRVSDRPRRRMSAQRSPTLATRSGMFRSVNVAGSTSPRSTSCHVHGADTGALLFARTV